MEGALALLYALLAGIGHAFEPDHLFAVSNIISRRDRPVLALRDGLYWGLGHTTSLVIFGTLILLGRVAFLQSAYFDALVGVLLIGMGASRLWRWNQPIQLKRTSYPHRLAYTVGALHGLAGSGALVLLVLSALHSAGLSLLYLLVFGLGSLLGMLGVAALCSLPFTPRMRISQLFKEQAVVLSSVVCIGYGGWMLYVNALR